MADKKPHPSLEFPDHMDEQWLQEADTARRRDRIIAFLVSFLVGMVITAVGICMSGQAQPWISVCPCIRTATHK